VKLSMMINYVGDFPKSAQQVVALEKVGLDMVWVAEAYSYDAISQIGYLAAVTSRVEIGTGIINVYSRTPALVAMTAAGCDYVSNGRFVLGLGASGPQVVEGFHGVPYEKPMQRIREYIDVCRAVWAREKPLEYDGTTVQVPLLEGTASLRVPPGTGSGKRMRLKGKGVQAKSGAGDLYAVIRVEAPKTLSDEDRAALERMKSSEPDPRADAQWNAR